MPKGIYIRTKIAKNNIGKASKGRHTLIWYIEKYGAILGKIKYSKRTELRSNIAKNQNRPSKGKSYEILYGEDKAKLIKNKLIKSHTGIKQSIETKLKRSASLKGRTYSVETLTKISTTRKRKMLSGEIKLSSRAGCGKGGFKEDIGHYIRSSYEHRFCKFLKNLKIRYEYEPKRFVVFVNKEKVTFTPDFCINGIWFEIKNSYNVTEQLFNNKLKSFKKLYTNEKIYVIIGNLNNINTWTLLNEQKDLVEILVKLTPLGVIKG